MYRKLTPLAALLATARAQQACSLTTETHPSMTWKRCAAGGSCTTVNGQVTIDANWRWLHSTSGSTNCYTGNKWNDAICSTNLDCAEKCCVDGASYASTYGVTTSGDALNLKFVTKGSNTNVGSRLYLMASDTQYQMFNLLGNEFTFDVDVSNLPCGLNGALYFVSMDADGGASKFPSNKAGAKYGTGYCDSQCPRDLKFINGQANIEGWTGSTTESGVGSKGACCAEMDIWEANSISTAYTPHPCSVNEYHSCNGDDCGGTYSSTRYAGDCDPDGCDFNSYRQGDKSFYGAGLTVDTTKKITVVTQFLTGSDGTLSEIKRFYVQGGKVIPNSQSTIAGVTGNSITKNFCDAQKKVFNDTDIFTRRGGLAQMGEALKSMVLVMSLWDDYNSNMLWLDSTFPVDSKNLGAQRGTCPTTSGKPADVEANAPNSNVIYSNIKFGPIGSTFSGSTDNGSSSTTRGSQQSTSTRAASSTRTSSAPSTNPTGGVSQRWEQCGGNLWKGPTTCVAGTTCVRTNEWYSQCL